MKILGIDALIEAIKAYGAWLRLMRCLYSPIMPTLSVHLAQVFGPLDDFGSLPEAA